MSESVEHITHDDQLMAIIIRADYRSEGIKFFTPDSFSQQLAYMNRPAGYEIPPHVHNPLMRSVEYTLEVLFIRKGSVEVDFFDNEKNYLRSTTLNTGDVILLATGGHGFRMMEDSEIIEVKQGPYAGDGDKTRFESHRKKSMKF